MQNINKFTEVYIFVPSITIRRKLPYMESRVKEIDYLKCIFITLMIIFHLVYIGDKDTILPLVFTKMAFVISAYT